MTESEQVLTTCAYCGVGCGLVVSGRDDQFTIRGDMSHPANRGRICSKGSTLADTVSLDGRLLRPQIDGQDADWTTALDAAAAGFRQAISKHGPESVAFYVSGQLLTEDYYVANKLMKGFIGSANIDTNSRLCMASSVVGHKRAFGKDTVPGCYDDLELADLVVLVGSNLAWCHPVLHQRLSAAKQANPTKKIVVIDPRRTATAESADMFLPIKPGTDATLFNGLLSFLAQNGAIDHAFIESRTDNWALAQQAADSSARDVESVAKHCGIDEALLRQFYICFMRSGRTVTVYSQGVNQSTSGTDNVNSIINVHLATGRIGKRGCGPFSITGQPNAMGGREVGGLANQLAAHMDFEPADVDRVSRFWDAPAIATKPGLTAVDLFEQLAQRKIKAIWIMGTNPAVSMPDSNRVKAALAQCEVVVVSDCIEHTDSSLYANIMLPTLAWGEKQGTVTNSERCISRQRAFLPAPGEARADWWVISEVAKRLGHEKQFSYSSSADIFREHAALSCFENSDSRDFDIGGLADLSDLEYETFSPTYWPKPATDSKGERRLFTDMRFYTKSGKANFIDIHPQEPSQHVSERYPLVLNTGRLRDQWHTMTRSGRSHRLSENAREPLLELSPVDAEPLGVTAGGLLTVTSAKGRVVARAVISDTIAAGQVFMPIHWNGQFASDGVVGSLLGSYVDPHSHQPELKFTPVSVEPYECAWYAFMMVRGDAKTPPTDYWSRSAGDGFWQYELAGKTTPDSWTRWAHELLGNNDDLVEFHDNARKQYRCAMISDNRLQACVFVSESPKLTSKTWLSSLFRSDSVSDSDRMSLLSGIPGPDVQDNGPILCACFSVGRNTLLDAIQSQELDSVEAIGNALSAGTNCGSCVPELNRLLERAGATL